MDQLSQFELIIEGIVFVIHDRKDHDDIIGIAFFVKLAIAVRPLNELTNRLGSQSLKTGKKENVFTWCPRVPVAGDQSVLGALTDSFCCRTVRGEAPAICCLDKALVAKLTE